MKISQNFFNTKVLKHKVAYATSLRIEDEDGRLMSGSIGKSWRAKN
jgi:hypothetical protein